MRLAGAEDGAEETALRRRLRGAIAAFQRVDAVFELFDMGCCRFQTFFLNDHRLGEIIGGCGLIAYGVCDQSFRLAVTRGGGCGFGPVEQGLEKLAFFR